MALRVGTKSELASAVVEYFAQITLAPSLAFLQQM
jgi:hypothetical protein